jgi:dolichol kinase
MLYGIFNTDPTLMVLIFLMSFSDAMAATVTANLTAMNESVSPAFTV